jgi:aminopeptidase N
VVDPENIRKVYQQANQELATTLYDDWYWAYRHYEQTHLSYQPSPEQAGPRALRGLALQMLLHSAANEKNEGVINEAYHFVQFAGNMTERYQALTALVVNKQAIAPKALDWFYHYFVDEALVIDKWFSLQARNVNNASEVQTLIEHEAFTLDNPNRLRSVIFSFCQQNLSAFHQKDGSGYHFWQTTIHQLDGKNPHMAARLARSMDLLPKLATPYQVRAKDNIKEVLAQDHLSKETREVLARIDATV